MITFLALLPSIALLIYIYIKDRQEKEPLRLLIKCFIFGILIIIPILIMEEIIENLLLLFIEKGSSAYAFTAAFFVAALSEELFKYLALKKLTWKSPAFNCTFDGIVYAVFVSLGFATFENILYVMDDGVSAAIFRMFTAVPCHAFVAVFMGYFYSKAKMAGVMNNRLLEKQNKLKALLVPILCHGLYDCPLLADANVVGSGRAVLGLLFWIAFIIVQTVFAFKLVNKASKMDAFMYVPTQPIIPQDNISQPITPEAVTLHSIVPETTSSQSDVWVCKCKNVNNTSFCPICGTSKKECE